MKTPNNIRFATFFPGTFYPGSSIHLLKDVGTIPYILHREYGYDAWLIAYGPDNEMLLKDVPAGLNMLWLWKGPGFLAMKLVKKLFKYDSAPYLAAEALCAAADSLPLMLKHGKTFDVFQLYHFKPESMLMAVIYRLFNRKGLVYMKFDMDPDIIKVYRDDPRKKDTIGLKIANYFFKGLSVNIFSAESKRVYEFLRTEHPLFKKFSDRVLYIPNGVDMKMISDPLSTPKERIVLHAGRICNPQKRTNVILEAFSMIAGEFPGWKLVLVGPMDEKYRGCYEDFIRSHEDIRLRIEYKGFLESREDVFMWYRRSRIFAIPSRFESFGLVTVEAQLFGDVILGSDIPAVRELTNEGELGYLCPVDDVGCFADRLRYMMSHEEELAGRSASISEFARKNFDWNVISGHLNERICGELGKRDADE